MLGKQRALTQHLLLFVERSSSQHGGGQWLLSLDNHSRLRSRKGDISHPEDRTHNFILIRLQLYLLHGDLRLSVDVLLGVAYSCGILVLGHPPHGIGCYGSSGGGGSGTHGLGGCGSRLAISKLLFQHTLVVGSPQVKTYQHAGWLSCEAAARKAAWNRTSEGVVPRSAWHFACFGNLKPTLEPFTDANLDSINILCVLNM